MPLVVSCRCGQRFAANEQLIGQRVPCPACGHLLSIGTESDAPQGIIVTCACGRSFSAPPALAGQQTRCPACRGPLLVPGPVDPLAGDFLDLNAPLGASIPLPPREAEIPWDTLQRIGIVGGVLLFLVIVTITTLNALKSQPEVAATPQPSVSIPAPAQPSAPLSLPPGPASLPPPPGATPDEASTEKTAVPITSEKAASSAEKSAPVATAKLPQGVQDWYTQPGSKLAGLHRVNTIEPSVAQFSWMTDLLPFLGHQKVYDRFDFKESLGSKSNIQVGGTVIPEFLNPLDDRQRWNGYPFHGIALSHFVGISGVEDARNVVAAKLPRTDPRAGVFGYEEVAREADITDGKSQTMMVAGAGELANPWVFGGGATIRGAREPVFDKTSGFGSKNISGGGTIAVMADGSVRQVSANVDPRVFKAMCTIRGADSVDIERDSQPFDLHSLREAKK